MSGVETYTTVNRDRAELDGPTIDPEHFMASFGGVGGRLPFLKIIFVTVTKIILKNGNRPEVDFPAPRPGRPSRAPAAGRATGERLRAEVGQPSVPRH